MTGKPDPLYVIFEQHLYNFQDSDSDRKTFITTIVTEYLALLRQKNIAVPKSLEAAISEELADQVSLMLTKKIYGCSSIDELKKETTKLRKKKAKQRYDKIAG
jgi:long-subunit fatty acid transport protein